MHIGVSAQPRLVNCSHDFDFFSFPVPPEQRIKKEADSKTVGWFGFVPRFLLPQVQEAHEVEDLLTFAANC